MRIHVCISNIQTMTNINILVLLSLAAIQVCSGLLTRLVPGPNAGRLEVYYGGSWGTVCDDGFGQPDAEVACRGLGLELKHVYAMGSAYFGQGSGNIVMDNVGCSGTETSIDLCLHNGWNSHNCGHSEDVGVACFADSSGIQKHTTVSLDLSTVRVFSGSTVAIMCSVRSAVGGPYSLTWSTNGSSFGTSSTFNGRLVNVDNNQTLTCLVDKDGQRIGNASVFLSVLYPPVVSCQREYDVPYDTSVTISCSVDASPHHDSISWWQTTPTRQLLGTGTSSSFTMDRVTASQSIVCTVVNTMVNNEGENRTGNTSCEMNIRVQPVRTRLAQGSASGRLEVYSRTWGTVCSNNFDDNDARVACRGLDLPTSYSYAVSGAFFASGSGPVLFNYNGCDGNESSLNTCPRHDSSDSHCTHEGVGVLCAERFADVLTFTTVTTNVSRIRVMSGTKVLVGCTVKTPLKSPFTYSWTIDGVIRGFSHTFIGIITNVDHGKTLKCSVRKDDILLGVSTISLLVLYAPKVHCPEEYIMLQNISGNINCSADAFPAPNAINWIEKASNMTVMTADNVSTATLTISDHGIYICSASNKMVDSNGVIRTGTGSCRVKVVVMYPPPPLMSAKVDVFEGVSVNLSRLISSNPSPHLYSWKRSTESDFNTGTPVLVDIQRTDAGTYIIKATNIMNLSQCGPQEGHGVLMLTVNVLYAPKVHCPEEYIMLQNISGNINCSADAFPAPNAISWIEKASNMTVMTADNVSTATLTISDHGMYVCSASNKMVDSNGVIRTGTGSCRVKVVVMYPPPPLMSAKVDVFEGVSVNLSRLISSNPSPHLYSWKRSTESDFNTGTPVLVDIQRTDAGTYIIKATNIMNLSQSGSQEGHGVLMLTVNVLYAPKVHCPEEYIMLQNISGNISCSADAFPAPNAISWIEKASNMTVMTADNVSTATLTISDHGMYVCSASNKMVDSNGVIRTGTGSCRVKVVVMYPPPPLMSAKVDVFEGVSVNLSRLISSNPSPHLYSWKRSTESDFNTGTPVLVDIQRTDAGTYIIKATNIMNLSQSGSQEGHGVLMLTVNVLYAPKVHCPEEYIMLQNISGNINCSADAFPAPNAISWIEKASNMTVMTADNVSTATLTISDDGMYICSASNKMVDSNGVIRTGTGSCRVKVVVMYPPPPLMSAKVDVFEGVSVNLSRLISSNPSPHLYSWKRSTESDFNTGTPVLADIQRTDAGTYIIKATNIMNLSQSGSQEGHGVLMLTVNVLYAPKVHCPEEYTMLQNISGNINCSADAFPAPNAISWIEKASNMTVMTADNVSTATLTISDHGMYVCSASNKMVDSNGVIRTGTGSCRVKVVVMYPPPPLMSAKVDVFEGVSVNLSRLISSNPSPHLYSWKRSTESDFNTGTPVLADIQRTDAGTYIIKATNIMNLSQSGPQEGHGVLMLTVNVLYAPKVHCPEEYTMLQNISGNINCSADAFPAPNAINWIEKASNMTVMTADNVSTATLTISDHGMYVCSASNKMVDSNGVIRTGTGSCRVKVVVMYPPPPLKSTNVDVFEGTSVNLLRLISSNPSPHLYSWKRSTESDFNTGTPVLDDIQRTDAGTYIIRATNIMNLSQGGPQEGHGVLMLTVNVLYAPVVHCLKECAVPKSKTHTLSCSVEGFPMSHLFKWIQESSNTTIITGNSPPSVKVSDDGVYICTATNTMTDFRGVRQTRTGTCRINITMIQTEEKAAPETSGVDTDVSAIALPLYAIYATGGAFGVLCLINIILIFILCKKKQNNSSTNGRLEEKINNIPLTESAGESPLMLSLM
ncbi:hemicentin-1-like [Haliotis cracherodii]|uniref:hemicentin-1-like n=1 Tax=Haliotis cracherodii TaxID=6455 RepID=UPI0039EC4CC2